MPVDSAAALAQPGPTDVWAPRPFVVRAVHRNTDDTVTVSLEPRDGEAFAFAPGQFTMLSVFGIGEVPISISGDPADPGLLVHTVRDVGAVTHALCAARPGDVLGVRGPYGVGWNAAGRQHGDLLVVAGGIGLAPLRPVLLEAAASGSPDGRVCLLYGARTPQNVLFDDELERWATEDGMHVAVTVDLAPTTWPGRVGLVTDLIRDAPFDPARTLALLCGPEVMMRYVAAALTALGVPPDRVRLSMERNMRCGVGLCGHCQLREFLVCVDGPVFPLSAVGPLLGVREL